MNSLDHSKLVVMLDGCHVKTKFGGVLPVMTFSALKRTFSVGSWDSPARERRHVELVHMASLVLSQ